MRLLPVDLWVDARPGPLRPQALAALSAHGEPLRWAITAVESMPDQGSGAGPARRFRLEAMCLEP